MEKGEKVIQLVSTHFGTVFALTDRGRMFEQIPDPRPVSNHVDARNPHRVIWREVAGPDFS